MFGISWAEFSIIMLVAVLVIPARLWPDVARFLAQVVKFVRGVVWKITDASEKIKEQIDLEQPIDELIKTTTDDILAEISVKKPKTKKAVKVKQKSGGKKK